MELTDKQIKDLVERRHPEYLKKKEHWDFLASTYAGGRAWFTDNIFRYFKEGDQEFKERLERAYRFNHTREVVNLINKYLFKEDIHRNTDEAPEQIRHFWRRATRQNASIDAFMAAIDLQSSIYGRIWVVVDSTMNGDVESVADEKNKDARAYAYWISPQQMLDVAWDDDGNMLWALIVEVARDDADPFTSTGQEYQRYRLWTQNEWYLFREEVKRGSGGAGRRQSKVVLEDSGEHKLGMVPVFPVDCIGESESPYFSPSLIDDNRVRVIMKFPSLRSISKKTGDTNGTTVQYRFQIANGDDTFRDAIPEGEKSAEITLTAKKSGVYYRSYELKLPKPGRSYKIRVTRLTDDSTSSYLFNDTWVDSIGEIVDTPMNYPNSVLCGLKVNSEQFGGTMPARSYLVRGLKIRVPANYNETSNTYVGVWDGTFKLLSSSNPAWILFDLLTNTRYGLGQFVSESMIDLGQLYQIGRYCDEEVNDGFGGKEKRFAINTQITSRQDAYRLIQDIAGAFRGMVFWAGGMVNIMQDSPSDPVMMFTNANVKDGMFTYKGSARKDRPSVALITYNNKEDGYKQNVEYVEDQEAMARYGERKTESVAFGCTSRGQAHRVGLWLLYTARMESDMITFTAGLDASFLMPGETVLIQNKYRAGKRNSGRIMAFDRNSITLDAPVKLMKSGSFIRILNQDAEIVERDILETGESITKVTFTKALAPNEMPVLNGVWMITEPDLEPMRVRIISIAQGDTAGSFDITAVENNPTKYEAIDNGATLIAQNTTVLDPTYSKPSNLQISEGTYISSPGNLSVKLIATWEGKSPEYWISWRRSDENHVSNWQSARVTEEQYEIANVAENGQYDFQLYAVSFTADLGSNG